MIDYDDSLLCAQAYVAGMVLLSAAQVADLAAALRPVFPEHSAGMERAAARAWLTGLLDQVRQRPITLATSTQPIDTAGLWRSACAGTAPADSVPLVRQAEIIGITKRLAPWFDAAGYGDLDEHVQVECIRWWLYDLLNCLRAAPLALATGTQQLVPSALLRARVGRKHGPGAARYREDADDR
ncbi:MAG TPA: hypothetical protein VFS21_16630 [Roseiflexaceae bacterium]|nr:hypothetical protein [Roseiflexaceae bacterium]